MTECSACGCNDVEEKNRQIHGGEVFLRLYCRQCFYQWSERAPEPPAAVEKPAAYQVLVCRQCGGGMKVSSTRGMRHLKCKGCDRSVQLAEEEVRV